MPSVAPSAVPSPQVALARHTEFIAAPAPKPAWVHVTGRVEARLRDDFDFEPRGVINLKGKSATLAFFLVGPRDE